MKKITFSVFLFVFTSTLFSQTDQKQDAKEVPEFVKMQQEFNDWAKGKDLSKEKGWKYYKRWEEQMAKRANADGSLPDEYEYFKAAMDVAAQKQKNNYTRSASWIPVGPFAVPSAPGGSGLDSYGISRINTISFHPTDSSTYWVGVAQGGVWKTTNGGASYMPLTDNLPILRTSDICVDPLRPDTMYISLCDFEYIGFALNTNGSKRMTHYGMGVYKTTDGGQTWNPTGLAFNQKAYDGSLIRRVFINSTNANSVLAAGTSGIWKSADGGTTWSKTLDSLIWDIERDPVNKNTLYASGGYVSKTKKGSACILKSTDFGTTWTLLNTGIPRTTVQRIELAISPSDPNYVYAVCCNISGGLYGIYRTTNAGINWSQRCTTPNILGSGGNASGGQGTYDLTIIVNATDRNTIYTGGLIIWGSSDGGTTMTQITDYGTIHPDQHFFAYNPLNKNYYMCNDGGIYKANPINIALNTTKWKRLSDGLQTPSYYKVNTSK
ncbi:MAG: exo-alpha-sialidase, partial [Bacteroidetes bacterium]|nr:exo-alpha-sialidase [Bacteroidota bacterium]